MGGINMTPEKQRIAIAEACGWRRWRFGDPFLEGLWLADKKFNGYIRTITRVYPNGVTLDVDKSPLYSFDIIKQDFEPVNFWINSMGRWWKMLPDYLNNLNAMHEAEKTLNNEQYHTFTLELSRLSWRAFPDQLDDGAYKQRLRHSFSATAIQRAEAFLRTLGLWEE